MRLETFGMLLPRLFHTAQALNRAQREREARERAEWQNYYMSIMGPSGQLGDGHLAERPEIERSGLFDANGLFLGAHNGRMLFFAGDGQLLTYARTGSGKGRDLILPNLAHVRDRSLIVVDVKDGENCYASIKHRAETLGQNCVTLNPFNLLGLDNTRINPLHVLVDIVADGGEIDTQAEEIAQILLPPNPRDGELWH